MLRTLPTRPTHPVLGALLATVLGLTLGLSPAAAPPAHADPVPASEPDDATSTPEEAEEAEEAEDESSWVEEPEAPAEGDESSETTDGSPFRIQPEDVIVPEGEVILMRTTVLSPFDGLVTWEVSTDDGHSWRASTTGPATVLAGRLTPAVLTVNAQLGATVTRNGEHRRAVLTYVDDVGETHVLRSSSATITVTPRAVQVSAQPESQSVVAGTPVRFHAESTGTTFPTEVKWQVSTGLVDAAGEPLWTYLAGADSDTLDLGQASIAMDGRWYRARFDNGSPDAPDGVYTEPARLRVAYALPAATGGAAPTQSAALTVRDTVRSYTGPLEVHAPAGTRITDVGTDDGSTPPTVTIAEDGRSAVAGSARWGLGAAGIVVTLEVDGDQQPGAVLDGGTARILRADGSALAESALSVAVLGVPEVTVQPISRSALEGQDVAFEAVATGVPSPTVQWQVSTDGIAWTDLPGETGTTLALDRVTTAQDGSSYRAVFTNTAAPGGVPSDPATLRVQPVTPLHLTVTPRVQVVSRLPA